MQSHTSVGFYRSLALIFSFLLIIAAVTWGGSIVRAQTEEGSGSEIPSEEVEKAPEEKTETPVDDDTDDGASQDDDDADSSGDGEGNEDDKETDEPQDDPTDGNDTGTSTEPTTPVEPVDTDKDGVADESDNCPLDANADQVDADEDGLGDACDDTDDSTPVLDSPVLESQSSGEEKKEEPQDEGEFPAKEGDADSDGIPDDEDNCALVANPDQEDSNRDDIGDACDEAGIGGGPEIEFAPQARFAIQSFVIPMVDMCEYEGNGEYSSDSVLKAVALLHAIFHGNDIIEPFFYGLFNLQYFPGLNWDEEGQAIFNNGCQPVEEISCLLEDQDAIIIDTFSRDDSATLGSTESDNGATPTPWITVEGDWEIINEEAVRTGGGNNRVMTVVDSGVSDAAVEVVLSNVPNAVNQAGVGLVFRYTDTSNFWYLHADPTRWYSLEKYEAGVHVQVATAPVVPADGDTIRVLLDGPFISIYVNGELYASVNDSFNEDAEMHGLKGTYWADETDASYDNFIITETLGQCVDESYDWGDAPDASVGGMNFPTTNANSGARHLVVPGIFLGVLIDADNDGHPHDGAIGDDVFDGNDDEDGVEFTSPLTPGATSTATVTASVDGYLSAWFDFNLDGDWDESDENIFSAYALTAGENYLTFPVPEHATQDTGISRWRFFTTIDEDVSYEGEVSDGEVEDYVFSFQAEIQQCTLTVVSDEKTEIEGEPAVLITPHPSWPSISGASWIWNEEVDGTGSHTPDEETLTFIREFVLTGEPVSVELDITADNHYTAYINGNLIGTDGDWNDVENYVIPVDDLIVGTNVLQIVVVNETRPDGYTGPNPGGLLYRLVVEGETDDACVEPDPEPTTSSVTICKLEDSLVGHALPDWTVMLLGEELETVEVNSDGTLASSQVLPADDYLFVANGVYNYRNAVGSTTDAAFSMRSYEGDPNDPEGHPYEPWVDVNDLLSPGYLGITVDGDIPGTDWGTVFNPLHQYALAYTSDGDAASFKIWDDGYNDNFGSLFVDIYESDESFVGVTEENGCVTFEDVPFGTYQLDEIMQDDWEFVESSADKDGNVEVDAETEEFYIVNTMVDGGGDEEDESEIIEPLVGEIVGDETTDLVAYYADENDDDNDNVQWAVRAGTCAAGTDTVFGNVDGFSTPFTWDSTNFFATIDMTGLDEGMYCFVFNPTEDAGDTNQRLTREFFHEVDGGGKEETSETIVVSPTSLNGWYFWDDVADTPSATELAGEYEFVFGPATPPQGDGSVQMTVDVDDGSNDGNNERWNIATNQFAGLSLGEIEDMAFETYQPDSNPGSINRAIYLNFDVDFYNSVVNGYQGRLVFVPADNQAISQNTWQEHDALNGMWRWSGFADAGNQWPDGNTDVLRSWSDIVSAFPDAEVFDESFTGQLLFRAGEPYADGFVGSVDDFLFKIGTHTTTYDFEPEDVGSDEPTLTLVKEIIGGDDDTFSFELSGVTSTSTDITTDGGEGSVEIVLGVGTTTITELLEQDWDLEDVVCEYYGDSEGVSVEGGHEIYAEEGDHITCTFTNEYVGGNSPTPSTGGGSGNSTSSARRSGFSGGGGEVLGATTDNNFCPFLLSYLHIDHQNDPSEVNKAKAFFNSYLGLNLPLDGTFDQGLFGAVVNFQNMFKPDILDTWAEQFDINDNPTGYIYQTTKWKINSIMCPGYEAFPDLMLDSNV